MPDPKTPRGRSNWRILFANLLALIGISALGRGLWMFSPALSFCVIGCLLFTAGILSRFK